MFSKKTVILIAVFAVVIGCSKKEDKTTEITSSSPETKNQAVVNEVKKEYSSPLEFHASTYTDDAKWFNGIDRHEKNRFFFTINRDDPTPLMPGYKIEFAKSGETVVVDVYRIDKPDSTGIFVTVDKDLDPVGDGYPNPIFARSLRIQTGKYSQENVWRNGISLQKPGLFFFNVKKNTYIPFKIGDRLKFAAAGEMLIKGIFLSEKLEKYTQVFITVDKTLDPVGDGYPNYIEMIF
jgi:hypothetical protein